MGTHNICLNEEVGKKKYTGCILKTKELLDCALIGVSVVIRVSTVCLIYSFPRKEALIFYANCLLQR